jgi:hypothetical protein
MSTRSYTHFVVDPVERYIRSGWEYEEDAKDALREDREDGRRGLKVVARRSLERLGLDPEDKESWMRTLERVRSRATHAPQHIQQDVADYVFHQVTSSDRPLSGKEASAVVAAVTAAIEAAYRKLSED